MNFGIFYYGTEPRDRGLAQLAQLLSELGHKPLIVCRKGKYVQRIPEFQGVPVVQLPLKSGAYSHFQSIPLPMNWNWTNWALAMAKKYNLDGMFVRETHLSNQIIAAARKLNLPVYLDMRENLSAMYRTGKKRTFIRRLTRPVKMLNLYESSVLPKFDHIFTVSDELGAWAADKYNLPKSQFSTLSNFPSSHFLEQAETALNRKKEIRSLENRINLVHAGYVTQNRGLQDILKALKIVIDSGIDAVHLRIIGQGDYVEDLEKMVVNLGIQENVEFLPMLPPDDVADALAECHIGVCAYLLNEQTHQTLPGKLFEYMALGIPVLSSARKPVVKIIEKEKCGIIYYSREPEEIAQKIITFIENSELRKKMGERSRLAILERYNQGRNKDVLKNVLLSN